MTRVPFTYTWIEHGKILAGSIPQLPEDMAILRDLGIQTMLSLTRRDIRTYPGLEWPFVHYGIAYGHNPMPDGGMVDNEGMIHRCDLIRQAIANPSNNLPIYVHCRGGVGRTGTILLGYYVLFGSKSLAEARDIVKVRRNYEGNVSAIDQGSPQREWIDNLETLRDSLK